MTTEEATVTVGIDLGSTYSRVAVWKEDHAEIIVDDQGHRRIPSYVSFNAADLIVGEEARHQIYRNPDNTVFEVKQFIGRQLADPRVQGDLKRWPFHLIEDAAGKPQIQVSFQGETRHFTAEQISAFILRELKEVAENDLGLEVPQAVIAVPATFTYSQRHATMMAGKIAGLHVIRTLSAVDAAAIAYGLAIDAAERNVLIFDFGGGSLDMAIVVFDSGVFEVRAIAGDSHLGGVHVDQLLVEYCMAEFQRLHHLPLAGHARAIRRLYTACEVAKRTLSKHHQAFIDLDSLLPGMDLCLIVTRSMFDALVLPVCQRALHLVDKLLHDAKMTKDQLQDLVMVGGSSRIPKLREMLCDHLCIGMSRLIDTDEAIACGAAIQAAIMTAERPLHPSINDILLLEVAPLSLGVEVAEGMLATVVRRNTTLPAKKSLVFTTALDDQTSVAIRVFQGEHGKTADDHFLGEFLLDVPLAPRGQVLVDVTFDLDANALLKVTAVERSTGVEKSVEITGEERPSIPSTLAPIVLAPIEHPSPRHKRPLEQEQEEVEEDA